MKFRIQGTYEMRFGIAVDEVIEADSEEEALEIFQDEISAEDTVEPECSWANCGPNISVVK